MSINTQRHRVFVAGLFHETHSFLNDTTGAKDFVTLRGDAFLATRGDASPLGGVLEYAERCGWQVLPGIWGMAVPGGVIQDSVWESYWQELQTQLRRLAPGGVDAIYLVLHGAMVTQSYGDAEGELLCRIRSIAALDHVPIYGVLDLHANVSQAMIDASDCLVAYRENPHSDARESAVRAAEMLRDRLSGRCPAPRQRLRQVRIMWPPTGTGSASDPMKSLLRRAREIEASDPKIACINVIPGFAFADTPDSGLAFSIIGWAEEDRFRSLLDSLEELAWDMAPLGVPADLPLDDSLSRWKRSQPQGLTVVAEPSDNIGGGAPGDGTGLLRGLLRHDIQGAAICLNDPDGVAILTRHLPGDRVTLAIGGRGSSLDAGPLEIDCELVGLYEGKFELEDKQSHLASVAGDRFDMGPSALIRHCGVTILLTSHRTPPMDLGQWRCVGIDPQSFSLIGVKAAVAHRRAYDPIATHHLTVATPGPCASDLTLFQYARTRRPIYPLDPIEEARAIK